MKKTIISAAILLAAHAGFAQTTDSTQSQSQTTIIIEDTATSGQVDTIRIGSMVIIKKEGKNHEINIPKVPRSKKRLETDWVLLDLGYSNVNDKTVYGSGPAQVYAPGLGSKDFNIRNGKSFNINVWLFRQRLGITKNNVFNLTYGFMVETNNFRYEKDSRVSYRSNYAAAGQYAGLDTISFSKNKLAASYFTVPLMLGFTANPKAENRFTVNAGVSFGYRYSSRNKQISDERGKEKIKGGFGLETFKWNYVAEIGYGSVRLYGSYAPNSMFKNGLDMRPFTIGVRLGG